MAAECTYLCSSIFLPSSFKSHSSSTPLYQFLDHALSDPTNRTKFTLIYANISPSDILLREELDKLQQEHSETFDIIYVIDKSVEGWISPTGYVNEDLIKKHVASKDLGEKVKVFVCGKADRFELGWWWKADNQYPNSRSSWSGCDCCWPKGGHEARPA